MSEREIQMAKTEVVFREVNEGIAQTAARFDAKEANFVCECADADCTVPVPARIDEYETVREDATHFLLAEGHDEPSIERVIRRRQGSIVVEKFTDCVTRVVRRLDPRGGGAPGVAGLGPA